MIAIVILLTISLGNLVLALVQIVVLRRWLRLNAVLMDIILRAWVLRRFPDLMLRALDFDVEGVEITEFTDRREP